MKNNANLLDLEVFRKLLKTAPTLTIRGVDTSEKEPFKRFYEMELHLSSFSATVSLKILGVSWFFELCSFFRWQPAIRVVFFLCRDLQACYARKNWITVFNRKTECFQKFLNCIGCFENVSQFFEKLANFKIHKKPAIICHAKGPSWRRPNARYQ